LHNRITKSQPSQVKLSLNSIGYFIDNIGRFCQREVEYSLCYQSW